MIIEIWTKEKYSASEEAALSKRLGHAGLAVEAARLSRLYKVDGDFTAKEFRNIASELLVDKITEKFSLNGRPHGLKGAYRAEVWLKDLATDPVGETVKEAVEEFSGKTARAVRFGHAYYVACGSELKLRHAVGKTLVNEIVNISRIEKI